MLDVTATQPALWRMQVLEAFDNRALAGRPAKTTHLPEPAARAEPISVEVRGLRNRSLVSPGRITSVIGTGGTLPEPGDARALLAQPKEGNTYRVEAATVHTTAARLARIPMPDGAPLRAAHPDRPRARRRGTSPSRWRGSRRACRRRCWGPIGAGSSASPGACRAGSNRSSTVVRRVEDYLLDGDRYHYTTEVGAPGREPLLEFLFHTHKGYCQHFAGAAALILRVAGVPTRVVVGFATGEPIGHDTYAVRDEDAHAWIEVYFPGVGWVPFNPTPSSAPADVSAGIDVLRPASAGPTGAGGTRAAAARRRRRGRPHPLRRRPPHPPRARPAHPSCAELLVRLAPEPSGPRTTLRSLHPTLTEIGPATADLALVAERARFGATAASADPPHPGWMVWRALVADVGLRRATS